MMEKFEPPSIVSQCAIKEDAYWLGLQDRTWIVPAPKIVEVYNEYGSLFPLWNTPQYILKKIGIDDESIRKFMKYKEQTSLQSYILKKIESMQLKIIRYVDKDYPNTLKLIENPPLILLHKGNLLDFENSIAIAGTRNPSTYGRIMARKIGKALAEKGFTVVSGLARGIDEWAHCGALEVAKGRSIAVLAWMDPTYPEEHTELVTDLQSRGAIIAENFKQSLNKSAPARFVQRNRITSGISQCVIVIESDKEGGTVHQARIAISQKRKVFALQPKGNERAKRGFKAFLDMGAIPIKSAKEVLELLAKEGISVSNSSRLDDYYQHSLDQSFGKSHL